MKKRVLIVFSHPDDESFGPGGIIALWAKKGYEMHLLCATKGEIGNNPTNGETGKIREKELFCAAKILNITKVEFLGYKDGHISNKDVPDLSKLIEKQIRSFKPDYLLTFNLNGVSGHLDHVAIANAATMAFDKTRIASKLYYYTLLKEYTDTITDYFIHFPDGFKKYEIDETIDVTDVWETKIEAMLCHKSQQEDIDRILEIYKKRQNKHEHFMVRKRN